MFLITRIKGESLIFWHFKNFVLKDSSETLDIIRWRLCRKYFVVWQNTFHPVIDYIRTHEILSRLAFGWRNLQRFWAGIQWLHCIRQGEVGSYIQRWYFKIRSMSKNLFLTPVVAVLPIFLFFFPPKLVRSEFERQHRQLEQIYQPLASFRCVWTDQSVPNCSYILFVCHVARILPGLLHHLSRWSPVHIGCQIRSPLGSSLFHGKPRDAGILWCPNFHDYTCRYGLSDL